MISRLEGSAIFQLDLKLSSENKICLPKIYPMPPEISLTHFEDSLMRSEDLMMRSEDLLMQSEDSVTAFKALWNGQNAIWDGEQVLTQKKDFRMNLKVFIIFYNRRN